MADPIARTVENWAGFAGYSMQGQNTGPDKEGIVDVTGVSGGMALDIPREKIPPSTFARVRNGRVRGDWVGRREGTVTFGAPYPDALPVLKVLTYLDSNGNNYLIRITQSGIHVQRGTGWQAFAGNPLDRMERVSFTQMYGNLFLTNGGRVRMVDMRTGTITVLDSPRSHFVTSFGDRIVTGRKNSSTIAWSANLRPDDWESESSGEETLVQNTSDISDSTTGVIGLGRELVILRRRSIWVGERQAIAIAPFRFSAVVDDIGCDIPHSAVRAQGGIVFANYRLKSIFFFRLNARPEVISTPVEREMFDQIQNLQWVEGAYDPFEGEYVIGFPVVEGEKLIRKTWRFSFKTGSWVYDELPGVASLGEVSTPDNLIMIDDLVGAIDAQVGTIDSLGGEPTMAKSLLFMGGPNGEVIQHDAGVDTDWNGTYPEMEIYSQDLGSPSKIRSFMDAMYRIKASRPGSVSIRLEADNKIQQRIKPFGATTDVLRFPKPRLQGLELRFRLTCAQGDFKLTTYSLRLMEKGLARP